MRLGDSGPPVLQGVRRASGARRRGRCHPGPGQIRVLGVGRLAQARHAPRCLPARHENVVQALLCITMWITCVKRRRACAHIGEMLGIALPGRARNRAFTWESAIHALWTEKKAKLSTRHAAIAHK